MRQKTPFRCLKSKKFLGRGQSPSTDRSSGAEGTPFYSTQNVPIPYHVYSRILCVKQACWIVKYNAQNAPKTLFRGLKSKKNSGEGAYGAYGASMLGASILAPSALGVPVLFHLQFEPWLLLSLPVVVSRIMYCCKAGKILRLPVLQ